MWVYAIFLFPHQMFSLSRIESDCKNTIFLKLLQDGELIVMVKTLKCFYADLPHNKYALFYEISVLPFHPNLSRYSLGVTPNNFFTYLVKNDRLLNSISSAISEILRRLLCSRIMMRSRAWRCIHSDAVTPECVLQRWFRYFGVMFNLSA